MFANSMESAKAKFKKYTDEVFNDSWHDKDCYISDAELPDLVVEVTSFNPVRDSVYIFQDAGCC